jgi:demethylmenaquinone methyltransferase/2-methoxy-6-polyprenyl-1,4-benzoquinol methylase/phosphoethanolamine N-methyltransferase
MIRWAKYYDASVNVLMLGRRRQLRQQTVALAQIQPGERVLEVGCGTGDVALAASVYAGQSGAVVGIDPSPEMIAVAHAKAARAARAVDFQIGVIEALAFPNATFDVVLSSLMMHHLPDDLKREGLAEIARVLKPGGRVLIVDIKRPAGRLGWAMLTLALHGGLEQGVQDLPPLLRTAGFTHIDVGDTGFRTLGFVRGHTPA